MTAARVARRAALWLPAFVFLAAFAAYVPTLNPAFRADDSPETIATAVTLGIQHPPGYPLQTLLGRLAALLPLGSPAWRLNLMAAALAALACAWLSVLGWLLGRQWWSEREGQGPAADWAGVLAGGLAGLGLAYSNTFWSQALAAKGGIYTLHQALFIATLVCLARWNLALTPATDLSAALRSAWLRTAVLLLGLGMANHWETQEPLLLVAALLVLAPLLARRQGRGLAAALGCLALLGFCALAVYLYLPLRARLDPVLDWGDPRSWKQFWWVVERKEFRDLESGFLKSLSAALLDGGSWAAVGVKWQVVQRQGLRALSHVASIQADLGWPLALLSLAGWAVLKPWPLWKASLTAQWGAAWVVLLLVFLLAVTFYFDLRPEMVWILDVFLIPVYVAQVLLAGLGLLWVLRRLNLATAALPWAVAALLLLLPPAAYALRAASLDQSRQFLAWDFGQDLLLSLKPRAIFLAEGDFNTMPIYYLQDIRGLRPDVDHITTVFLSTDWGTDHSRRVQPRLGLGELPKAITGEGAGDGQVLQAALRQVVGRNRPLGRPFYASLFREVLTANVPQWEPGSGRGDAWAWRSSGLVAELVPAAQADGPADERRRLGLLKAYRSRHLELDRLTMDPSPAFALSNYGSAFLDTALYLREHHRAPEALALYRQALLWTSRAALAETWTHYGLALGVGGDGLKPDLAGSADCFRQALKVKPLLEAWANLAGVDNQLGQQTHQASYYTESESASRQALAMAPDNPQSWNNLGVSLFFQGRHPEALQAVQQAAQLAPQDPQIVGNLKAMRAAH